MTLDPSIYFIVVIPDWRPEEATPLQGFAMSLCFNSWMIRRAALLPTNIYDLTDEGRTNLLARRMSGTFPVNWYGQSPRAIRSIPNPPFIPFSLILLPESETLSDYQDWIDSSPLPPSIVAKSGAELSYEDLTQEKLQAHFLKVCDRIPEAVDAESIKEARQAIQDWKPIPARTLPYQVGGHNSVAPNLLALSAAGYVNMVHGSFDKLQQGIQPYVEQIVLTSNSILEERDCVGERDLQRIYRKPPDVNLFAPSIFPHFFDVRPKAGMSRDERRQFQTTQQALSRQTGYAYETRTVAQQSALFGKAFTDTKGKAEPSPHSLMLLRARELSLGTEVVGALAASEFSAVIRLPNEVNRTQGSVRSFAQHFRSDQPSSRKRLLSFRQVQARLASAVPSEFVEIIRKSKTGVRIIADAHLEWLDIDGLPLVIRKNCTRIPTTPGNLFVDQCSAHAPLILTPEHFKEILVISALKQEDPIKGLFEAAFEIVEPQWRDKLKLKVVEVSNAAELASALNGFDSAMVIFDGHGSHKEDGPGELHLGDEAVDVWSLKEMVHTMPPIVVLSACDTHAADRNHATTANGFMSLGARTVLSSVFPLDARAAAIFTTRLILRVAQFLEVAIKAFDQAVTWPEVISGMLRMQLLSDFLRQLRRDGHIAEENYKKIHLDGNMAINGLSPDPFSLVRSRLEEIGIARVVLNKALEFAVANSSVISYLQIGRPETILIDDQRRIEAQLKEME